MKPVTYYKTQNSILSITGNVKPEEPCFAYYDQKEKNGGYNSVSPFSGANEEYSTALEHYSRDLEAFEGSFMDVENNVKHALYALVANQGLTEDQLKDPDINWDPTAIDVETFERTFLKDGQVYAAPQGVTFNSRQEMIRIYQILPLNGASWTNCSKEEYDKTESWRRLWKYAYIYLATVSFVPKNPQLSPQDVWFTANLKALLGGEETLVKTGKQASIDRKSLADWILKHCSPVVAGVNACVLVSLLTLSSL